MHIRRYILIRVTSLQSVSNSLIFPDFFPDSKLILYVVPSQCATCDFEAGRHRATRFPETGGSTEIPLAQIVFFFAFVKELIYTYTVYIYVIRTAPLPEIVILNEVCAAKRTRINIQYSELRAPKARARILRPNLIPMYCIRFTLRAVSGLG